MSFVELLHVKENFIFGRTNKFPAETIEMHFHEMYEIFYCESESIDYLIEGELYRLRKGDLVLTNLKEFHKPIYNDNSENLRTYIQFKKSFLYNLNEQNIDLSNCFENRNLGELNYYSASQLSDHGVDKYIRSLADTIGDHNQYSKLLVKSMLIIILCKLNEIFQTRASDMKRRELKNEKVTEMLEYINMNLTAQITLTSLEKHIFLNKYYICHIFKIETGYSVMEYITYKRVMLAKSLLLDGVTPSNAGKMSGFNDYSNFYKSFKHYVGVSPKNFVEKKDTLIYKGEVLDSI